MEEARNRNDRERFLVDKFDNDVFRNYLDTTFNPIKRVNE